MYKRLNPSRDFS